jgi:RNA polymerase sigma factor (sigma-70 family)
VDEYRVDVRVRNNLLLSAIENAGFSTVAEFCRELDLNPNSLSRMINLKDPPLLQDGTFSTTAQRILDYLGALPEDLWTQDQLFMSLESNKKTLTLDQTQLEVLTYGHSGHTPLSLEEEVDKKKIQDAVTEVLSTLTPREKKFLELRFGLGGFDSELTLDEIGKVGDVSKERARQIINKALRKLKEPCRLERLTDATGHVNPPLEDQQ